MKKNPEWNGTKKMMNMALIERVRYIKLHVEFSESFRAKSTSKLLNSKCAKEVWLGKEIDYSNLKAFECKVYIHIPSNEQNKLKPKLLECIFLGFEKGVKGYK